MRLLKEIILGFYYCFIFWGGVLAILVAGFTILMLIVAATL